MKTPGRKARLLGQHRQRQRRQRRLLGRLDDDRAAGGQRRGHLARDHGEREIPRRDRRADADRLLDDDQPLVRHRRRNRFAIGALAFLGEPLDERGAIGHFALRLGQRLAALGGDQLRQIVGVLR